MICYSDTLREGTPQVTVRSMQRFHEDASPHVNFSMALHKGNVEAYYAHWYLYNDTAIPYICNFDKEVIHDLNNEKILITTSSLLTHVQDCITIVMVPSLLSDKYENHQVCHHIAGHYTSYTWMWTSIMHVPALKLHVHDTHDV